MAFPEYVAELPERINEVHEHMIDLPECLNFLPQFGTYE